MNNLVFNLGLIEMFSYWKTTCAPEIVIKAGHLDARQVNWWQDLLIKGLGQFFFENKIDFRSKNFVRIINDEKRAVADFSYQSRLKNRFLVPLGGGKDSIVTWEIFRKAGREAVCFSLNPSPAVKKIFKIGDCQKPIVVRRALDPKLLELNRQGFLNGHTPFSAYLAFLSVLTAVLFDYKYVAFSNERSANEGNVKYLGRIINHQHSKSFEFEQKFRQYCRKYLVGGVEYFSFLRPLFEIQIAKIFSRCLEKQPKYSKAFLSCNRAQAGPTPTGKWCGRCPKCLFVFICLAPFLGGEKTSRIFGKNLLADKKLQPIVKQLTRERGFKPFECVGTARETRAALVGGKELAKILSSWSSQHNLPLDLTKVMKDELRLSEG